MEIIHWAGGHGFDLLEAVGIIASLCFTAVSFRNDDKSRRIGNLFAIVEAHRNIWTQLYTRPALVRVLQPKVNLREQPVTDEEAVFINLLLQHMSATYRAMREGMFQTQQSIEGDIRWFFALPIPKSVWFASKSLLEPDFVEFVERGINS